MKLIDVVSIFLLIGLFACLMCEIPVAAERQAQIDYDIRVARCERDYMPGYCTGIPTSKHSLVEAKK